MLFKCTRFTADTENVSNLKKTGYNIKLFDLEIVYNKLKY